jgi:hypothetical protein
MSELTKRLFKLADAIASTDIVSKYLHDSFDGIGTVKILDSLEHINEDYSKLHSTVLSQQCFADTLRTLAKVINDKDRTITALQIEVAAYRMYDELPWYIKLFTSKEHYIHDTKDYIRQHS